MVDAQPVNVQVRGNNATNEAVLDNDDYNRADSTEQNYDELNNEQDTGDFYQDADSV